MPIEVFTRVKDGSIPIFSKIKDSCIVSFSENKKKYDFTVNDVWDNNVTSKDIFFNFNEKTKIYNDNYVITFGYTGTGKTYTTFGVLEEFLNFHRLQKHNMFISAYQIYNEKIYDLLQRNKQLQVWKTDSLKIQGLISKKILDTKRLLEIIKKNRCLAKTSENDRSSRSHAIITICINNKNYTFIDMAGQENGKTILNHKTLIRKQAMGINLNMLALKNCIDAYYQKNHIPFRRCLLTLALKDIFYKKCYVSFVCTVSCEHPKLRQIDSIRYASTLFKKKENNSDSEYFKFFKEYTDYIASQKIINAEEHLLWHQMKKGNYKNCKKMRNYFSEKIIIIKKMNDIVEKYTDKLPNINT